jgi:pyruvate,water dikinase
VVPDRPSDLVGEPRKRHRVLIEKVGEVGCRGIGAGPVRHLSPDGEGEDDFPAGAVLVAHETSPLLSPCVARASAVVTDVGSAASHLGTVACEFQVPTLLGTGRATELLPEGLVVTVDAEEGVVYEGEVRELLRHQLLRTVPSHSSTEFRLLRRMLRHIAPLNLVDPSDRSFSPAGCRTVHDVLRFAHEKAVAEISRGADRGREHVRELELPVPLDLILVDVGGAVRSGAPPKRIRPEHLACRPLRALLAGLTEPGVWATGPADLDLGGFFSSAIRSQAVASSAGAPVTRNVAVAGGEYLNLNLKLGYHFNVLDCQLGEDAARNYVSFFFVGGVTELLRRARRAELLDRILTARGFRMETRGDLVVGQLSGVSPDKLETELVTMGRLIGFTRQLDVLLRSEEAVSAGVTAFLEGRPPPVESPPPEEGPRRRRRGRRK